MTRTEVLAHETGAAHILLVKVGGEAVRTNALSGRLYLSKSGWLLMSVPNALGRGAFDALDEIGIELPEDYNAHVSVMRPAEVAKIGPENITERGHSFHYSLGAVKEVVPKHQTNLAKVWYIEVTSPELRALRRSYGLDSQPNGDWDFHLTIAVRRKKVLSDSDVSKAATVGGLPASPSLMPAPAPAPVPGPDLSPPSSTSMPSMPSAPSIPSTLNTPAATPAAGPAVKAAVNIADLDDLTKAANQSMLNTLLQAKAESDRANYAAKHALMRKAISEHPSDFVIDSDDQGGILGLTHVPTKFRMHLPSKVVPVPLQKMSCADAADWIGVPAEVARLVEKSAAFAEKWWTREDRPDFVFYDPDRNIETTTPQDFDRHPWILFKKADGAFRPAFDAMQLTPNALNRHLGGPTPLASTLAGGLLGAGLGYGGGYLAEKILGKKVVEPGRLRTVGALGAGLLGAAPGAYLGAVGARMKSEDGENPWNALIEPNVLFGKEAAEDLAELLDDEIFKQADAGGLFMPDIPVDSFNRTVWADPNTPVPIRAAATGLVESASQLAGGSRFITPYDVGRVAVGMGSGLISGMLVGRVLGAMAGLTPEAQGVLQQTGMWSGALMSVLPKAFGG